MRAGVKEGDRIIKVSDSAPLTPAASQPLS